MVEFIKKDILGSKHDYINLGKLLGEKILNSLRECGDGYVKGIFNWCWSWR